MTKKSKHIENTYKELSILASTYGLSFMMKADKKAGNKFFEYVFEAPNPMALSNKLIEIFIERNLGDYSFEQISITHHNSLNTLVPTEFFEADKARDLLDKNIKTLETDPLAFDVLDTYDMTNIYVPYESLNKFLLSKSEHLLAKHSMSVWLDKIAEERKNIVDLPVYEIYLNIFPKDFQILVFVNEKLHLANHFEFENTDEFLYYLFFVWETLEIINDKMHIYVSGIDKDHEIVKNLADFTANFTVFPALTSSTINHYITG